MSRVAYSATKDVFISDVRLNRFIPKMREGARLNHIGGSDSEIRSWQSNAPNVRNLLEESHIPDNVIVSFEYKVPNGGRIDCMLYGTGRDGKNNVIHIELKQWSNNTVRELYDNGVFKVDALTGGTYRTVCHPSQQVANYQTHLLNFVEELQKPDTNLEGMAYCYNYYSQMEPHALYANHYRSIIDEHRLYSADEIKAISDRIHDLLCNGSGLEIFNRVTHSRIRQSKTLLDAAANMFNGITEFSLLDDQITASETIFAEVRKASKKNGKTVILIKGGPGTGKTVIALHVLAQMAKESKARNIFFTTRSKALRESLKERLSTVLLENGNVSSASDMIANIFSFKPYFYKESEVDLLLVDEAHRVQKSANYMGDKFFEQTYLSQVTSLIYCAKTCVFFIDDMQAIKTEEIGNSADIRLAAKKYKEDVANYKDSEFYAKLQKTAKSLERNRLKREKLAIDIANGKSNDHKALSKIDEIIVEQERELTKFENIHQVQSTLTTDINIVELELKSQFRCNGSDNYLDWLDEVLYNDSANISASFDRDEYEFDIFDNPHDLYEKIKSLNKPETHPKQISRIAAGYCWKWSTELDSNGDLKKDVVIGDFAMPWETNNVRARGIYRSLYASSADTWAIEPEGVNQVGCIFSIQGFEIDYIGVILGYDIKYDKENDCLIGVEGNNRAVTSNDNRIYTRHIRNAYRVLMSRGKKGCFIYSIDPNVSAFIKRNLENGLNHSCQQIAMADEQNAKEEKRIVIDDYNYNKSANKTKYIPLFTIRAACGGFDNLQEVEHEGWIDVSECISHPDPHRYFVVHASGSSMEPKIHDGDLCIFEWYRAGSRNGEIVLTQCNQRDQDYGGYFTIKEYQSEKTTDEDGSWHHSEVVLHSLNPEYDDITWEGEDPEEYRTIGILKHVIRK